MLRYKLIFVCLALSACTTSTSETTRNVGLTATPCEGRSVKKCTFINGPVRLQKKPVRLFMREPIFFPTRAKLDFIDASQQKWTAPPETLTDGATIPKLFIPLVGSPNSPEFVNAAAVHDAYCGVGNQKLGQYHSQTWQQVHRMFYDALRVGGTPPKKAKIMFAAVYLGGPRWSLSYGTTKRTAQVSRRDSSLDASPWTMHMSTKTYRSDAPNIPRSLLNLPNRDKMTDKELLDAMKAVIRYINNTNPGLADIEQFLDQRESDAIRRSSILDKNWGAEAPTPAPY